MKERIKTFFREYPLQSALLVSALGALALWVLVRIFRRDPLAAPAPAWIPGPGVGLPVPATPPLPVDEDRIRRLENEILELTARARLPEVREAALPDGGIALQLAALREELGRLRREQPPLPPAIVPAAPPPVILPPPLAIMPDIAVRPPETPRRPVPEEVRVVPRVPPTPALPVPPRPPVLPMEARFPTPDPPVRAARRVPARRVPPGPVEGMIPLAPRIPLADIPRLPTVYLPRPVRRRDEPIRPLGLELEAVE